MKGGKIRLGLSYFTEIFDNNKSFDDLHMKTAIKSYRRLALKEFPMNYDGKT
ncbi:hypothetical protein KHA80_03270 [Anaerobacillus sp. HL2]|nr:hypothetical protein KHA80_03270 [Anaerobacillus sp. HL2]